MSESFIPFIPNSRVVRCIQVKEPVVGVVGQDSYKDGDILTPVGKNKWAPSVYFNWKRRRKLAV